MSFTTSAASRRAPSSGSRGLALGLLALTLVLASAAVADDLSDLRAQQRARVRSAALAKTEGGAPFGLLVVPVDFADARFSSPPDLGPRLTDLAPGSLAHYYSVASQERTRLAVVLSPVISLAGQRLDYSDLDLQGFSRTRAMAHEALTGAAAAGVIFADADADGDGEVDGVLLLHAGVGLENADDGLIVPLQYFLEETVVQGGVVARLYAVGAERSGLGLWAHETGHLLGLHDRYDTQLPTGGETEPRGGLGRFSLMAAGWQGSTGDGRDPALPDAYSRLQLGWADLATDLASGVVRLVGLGGDNSPYYYLAETRGSDLAAPYDGGLPSNRALLYRVDETLAEGEVVTSDPLRRQRVQLMEADGAHDVTLGLSTGEVTDMFPSDGQHQVFLEGSPNETEFTVAGDTVVLDNPGLFPAAWIDLVFPDDGASGPVELAVRSYPRPVLPDSLWVSIEFTSATWGEFTGGSTDTTLWLYPDGASTWAYYRPREPLTWAATAVPPAGATSKILLGLQSGHDGWNDYAWDHQHHALELDAQWLEHWELNDHFADHPWQRWTEFAGWSDPSVPVVACLPSGADPLSWPDVQYGNGVQSSLTTEVLGVGIEWVRFVHALDMELLFPGEAVDAASLTWISLSNEPVPAEPVDGWPGRCSPRAGHDLSGAAAFAWSDPLRADDQPLWRTEVVPVPDPDLHGPGPWRLRFELASNAVWRGRGWLMHSLAVGTGDLPEQAFAIELTDHRLRWSAPVGLTPLAYEIEARTDDTSPWTVLASVPWDSSGIGLADLGLTTGAYNRLRVIALAPDAVASRSVTLTTDAAEPGLATPRPNPARSAVTLGVDGAGDADATLSVYDLRGRLVRRWRPGGGPANVVWDGLDRHGRRVAAGVYIVRLSAHGRTRTTKMTWMQ